MTDGQTSRRPLAAMRRTASRAARAMHRGRRGQDVVGFAMLMPFVLFFIFMLVDFGVALGESHQINHAVHEATRAGAVGADEATIRQTAIDQSLSLLSGAAATCPLTPADQACIEVTWNDGPDANTTSGEVGDAITVRANYRHRLINPFLSWLSFAEIDLGACADSRVELEPASPVDRGWDCSS